MPFFSTRSLMKLSSCEREIQLVMNEVIRHVDITILVGHRTKEEQERAYREGYSQLNWPHSKHNHMPSRAVDIAPWPIDWNDDLRFWTVGSFIMGVGRTMGAPLRWGGLWDRSWEEVSAAGVFHDLGHFELRL